MGRMIGIDLGTTNSVVAVIDGPQPRVLDNRDGKPQTPSVVGLRRAKKTGTEDELLVGEAALDNFPAAPNDTIISIKRLMGRGFRDPEVTRMRAVGDNGQQRYLYEIQAPTDGTEDSLRVIFGGQPHSPPEVSAMILRRLKSDAEFRLGEPVTHAVITVPAYFSEAQKAATRAAAQLAGLTVIKLLDEPTAAAIAFGTDHAEDDEPRTILVFDLGGGTFDISVLLVTGGTFSPLALEGDMWLGGDDLHQVLAERVLTQLQGEYGVDLAAQPRKTYHRFQAALARAAQRAKETLTASQTAHIVVPGLLHDADGDLVDIDEAVTREDYERLIEDLVQRTLTLTRKALDEASLTPEDVDLVLLAGGSSMIPRVQQVMEDVFGVDKIMRKMHPKHCVALGAAVVASRIGARVVCPNVACGHVNDSGSDSCARCGTALRIASPAPRAGGTRSAPDEDDLTVIGISPMHYGILDGAGDFHLFVQKNDAIPTAEPTTREFRTRRANQRILCLPYYGRPSADSDQGQEKQGEVFAMMPPDIAKGTRIRIAMGLNGQGIMDDTRMVLENGSQLTCWITRGEADAKAIGILEEVERIAIEKSQLATPEELRALEEARQRAFHALRSGGAQAIAEAERVLQMVVGIGTPPLVQQTRNACNILRFIVQTYGTLIPDHPRQQIESLIADSERLISEGDTGQIEQRIKVLEDEYTRLPEIVRLLFGIKNAVKTWVEPKDPTTAGQLLRELQALDAALQRSDPAAANQIQDVLPRAIKEIEKWQGQHTSAEIDCPRCATRFRLADRYCPKCSSDSWNI